jgi:hypothetical protein
MTKFALEMNTYSLIYQYYIITDVIVGDLVLKNLIGILYACKTRKFCSVLRIRTVYPGSEFFPSRIQGQKDSGSRFRIRNKEFKYF